MISVLTGMTKSGRPSGKAHIMDGAPIVNREFQSTHVYEGMTYCGKGMEGHLDQTDKVPDDACKNCMKAAEKDGLFDSLHIETDSSDPLFANPASAPLAIEQAAEQPVNLTFTRAGEDESVTFPMVPMAQLRRTMPRGQYKRLRDERRRSMKVPVQ